MVIFRGTTEIGENFSDKNGEKLLTKKITPNGEKYITEMSEY